MTATLVLNDDPYHQANAAASLSGCTLSSLVEDAIRLLLCVQADAQQPGTPMPAWDMGEPIVDIDDSRAVQEAVAGA